MYFITFEGIDQSGKSTQLDLLADAAAKAGIDTLSVREPGGTPLGEQIREILLGPEHTTMDAWTEALLYAAARVQLVKEVIKPALMQGKIVLSDRYIDSSLVYQGMALEDPPRLGRAGRCPLGALAGVARPDPYPHPGGARHHPRDAGPLQTNAPSFEKEAHIFGNFPSLFMGLVGHDGAWEHYDGHLRFVDSAGNVIADRLEARRYQEFIGEAVESHSYLKSPFYRPLGYPDGIYRVGPLARLNVCSHIGTPLADQELREFRDRGNGTVTSSFRYHHARLIEILAAVEKIERALDDPDLMSDRLRADAGINQLEAVGVSEAPRGTLFHHYRVDEYGLIQKVNLIIATGQNNLAMNRTVAQIARHYVRGPHIPEGMLNRVEAGIRAYDPCLSCSTHAAGTMPLQVTLVGSDGVVLDEAWRT